MAETACPICQSWFVPWSSRHRYCSSACRKTAWERAHTDPLTDRPMPPRFPAHMWLQKSVRRRGSPVAAGRRGR